MKRLFLVFLVVIAGCTTTEKTFQDIDVQGHRGCRGIMPENTIPGFLKAMDLGVNTLEMDLAVTADSLVIVSHEPFFNEEISTDSTGKTVTEDMQLFHNIYRITYEQVKKFDVGLKDHPRFPDQKKMAVTKPLLSEVLDTVDAYANTKDLPLQNFNIEIKSRLDTDNIYHPSVQQFSDLVYQVISEKVDWSRVTIQSFDFRVLQYFKKTYPEVKLALLIENTLDWKTNIDSLGFDPDIYSSYYLLLSSKIIEQQRQAGNENFNATDEEVDEMILEFEKNESIIPDLQAKGVQVVPWTVNDRSHMDKLLELGVDGLITDYPNRLNQ